MSSINIIAKTSLESLPNYIESDKMYNIYFITSINNNNKNNISISGVLWNDKDKKINELSEQIKNAKSNTIDQNTLKNYKLTSFNVFIFSTNFVSKLLLKL